MTLILFRVSKSAMMYPKTPFKEGTSGDCDWHGCVTGIGESQRRATLLNSLSIDELTWFLLQGREEALTSR